MYLREITANSHVLNQCKYTVRMASVLITALDPNRSAMLLENCEELTPEDLGGVVSNLGMARPLVFLNACQIGRSALSLTDIGLGGAVLAGRGSGLRRALLVGPRPSGS